MIDQIIENALLEDIGDGDHSSLSCIPENGVGTAQLIVKDNGIIAGVELAGLIFIKFYLVFSYFYHNIKNN
jgi:nicotinate-nucleotide pyrophosphorylase (carboxylating)